MPLLMRPHALRPNAWVQLITFERTHVLKTLERMHVLTP